MKTGIDIGFKDTKIISANGRIKFASVVARMNELPSFMGTLENGSGGDNSIVLQDDGGYWLVGDIAQACKHKLSTNSEVRTDTDEYRILFLAALSWAMGNKAQGSVVTGLPISHFADRTKVESLVVGSHVAHRVSGAGAIRKQHFGVTSCGVVIQGMGVWANCFFNDNGKWKSQDLQELATNHTVGILDIGKFTTNLATFHKCRYDQERSISMDIGMSVIHDELANDIHKKYGRNLTDSIHLVDDALVSGVVGVGDKDKSVAALAKPHIEQLAETIVSRARSLWDSGMGCRKIIVSGGGASTVGVVFSRSYGQGQVVVSEDPIYDNASGYLKLAQRG